MDTATSTTQNPFFNVSDTSKPHFVLVPLFAQGHMIPMTGIALLLARGGATVSYITTPVNAARMSSTIARIEQSKLPITFVALDFRAAAAGLPDGAENMDLVPSFDLLPNFCSASCLLHDPLVLHLRSSQPPPTCIISDDIQYWTQSVADELNIPRLNFHAYGCFPLLCIRNIKENDAKDANEPFIIPGLPDGTPSVEITRAKTPAGSFVTPSMQKHHEGVQAADLVSAGVVLNTFEELEAPYIRSYQEATGKKVWAIGPVYLPKAVVDIAAPAAADDDGCCCLKWLDCRKPSSVVYVSFGSLVRMLPEQLIEIGLGLEESDHPFIWVLYSKSIDDDQRLSDWVSEFEERNKERGIVIRGWAPQVRILSHDAVGAFMTHCGWNSTVESLSLGVPMITWPHFGDQFLNEKLVVEVLRVGVGVGVKEMTRWGADASEVKLQVKKEDVVRAVRRLLDDDGDEAVEMRMRAKELGKKAKNAVEEGGSSYKNLTDLIEHMSACKRMEVKNVAQGE